jgi:molybdopterin converting factor small subunit
MLPSSDRCWARATNLGAGDPMVKVLFGSVLRQASLGLDLREFADFEGTVGELLLQISTRGGRRFQDLLFDGGELRRVLAIYVDGVDIRYAGGPATRVARDSQVELIPAVAGGSLA